MDKGKSKTPLKKGGAMGVNCSLKGKGKGGAGQQGRKPKRSNRKTLYATGYGGGNEPLQAAAPHPAQNTTNTHHPTRQRNKRR